MARSATARASASVAKAWALSRQILRGNWSVSSSSASAPCAVSSHPASPPLAASRCVSRSGPGWRGRKPDRRRTSVSGDPLRARNRSPRRDQWRLKYWTSRSCFSAALRVVKVPRLRRLPVLGFFLRGIEPVFAGSQLADHGLILSLNPKHIAPGGVPALCGHDVVAHRPCAGRRPAAGAGPAAEGQTANSRNARNAPRWSAFRRANS